MSLTKVKPDKAVMHFGIILFINLNDEKLLDMIEKARGIIFYIIYLEFFSSVSFSIILYITCRVLRINLKNVRIHLKRAFIFNTFHKKEIYRYYKIYYSIIIIHSNFSTLCYCNA